jgi:hypothetical protein
MTRSNPAFNLRLPTEIKEKITVQAEANKRSINAEIVAAIELSIAANGRAAESTGSSLPEGIGHLLKTFSADQIEKFVNEISDSAAERAIRKLAEKNNK